MNDGIESEEATSIARRLRHTTQGEWLSRYDPLDEEWLPVQMHMVFLRMGIVSHKESPEGGYMLTPLGLAVVEELKPEPGSNEWLRRSPNFHPGDIS